MTLRLFDLGWPPQVTTLRAAQRRPQIAGIVVQWYFAISIGPTKPPSRLELWKLLQPAAVFHNLQLIGRMELHLRC
jgi:hypothetical protein